MNKSRMLFFLVIMLFGVTLSIFLFKEKTKTPLKSSLAPAYQLAGKSASNLNRALGKVLPIDAWDEKEYGEAIALKYQKGEDLANPDSIYLNEILHHLAPQAKQPFQYRIFILPQKIPNALALPGGVILVTTGLLPILASESEIAAIIAHELGHIERGHCFNAVKYELLLSKVTASSLGKLADQATGLLLRHSYSKTLENEADDYAFKTLTNSGYDPRGVGNAFLRFASYATANGHSPQDDNNAALFRDYFMTHPPLPLRVEKYSAEANRWWQTHKGESRYIGKSNLRERACFAKFIDPKEWIRE